MENDIDQKKARLFVDMDGTLARFHDEVQYLEKMFEKDFFNSLKPFEECVNGIKTFISEYSDIEVFILSGAVEGEPPYCQIEKHKWLDKYLPEIDKDHRIFTDIGKSKSLFVPGGINKSDFLFDDYNKSLTDWEADGGTGVKCKNNINHKGLIGELWQGLIIDNQLSSEEIAAELYLNILFEENQKSTEKEVGYEQDDEEMEY